ncbi:MAG TPA: oligosaccharide flippase family protein [bacterium]|nr:oligosaccharide flippase family protein [bacterium]HPJ71681.1 oligosaccharide flippase family protein [bacterium]HPQ65712.1 oligosaccharide flippase family protein [bacterium]
MKIGHKAIRETTFLTVLNNCRFLVRMTANIFLARLLVPEYFGAIVFSSAILNFLNLVGRWGTEAAIVQEGNQDHRLADTIFTLTIVYGLFMLMLVPGVVVLLRAIGKLGNSPRDIRLIIVLFCLTPPVVFKIFSSVSRDVMLRSMLLQRMGMVELVGTAGAAVAGIVTALSGLGIWSLVIFHVLLNFLPALGYFLYSPYRPRLGWSKETARWFFSFGSKLFQASILQQVVTDGDELVIGTLKGDTALGIYNQAWKLSDIFQTLFITTLNRATLATFSRGSISIPSKARAFEFVSRCLFRFFLPFYLLMAYYARELIVGILGIQWMGVAPLLVLLLPWSLCEPFFILNRQCNLAMGRPQNYLSSLLVCASVFGVGIFPMTRWMGIQGAALVLDVAIAAGAVAIYARTRKLLPIRLLSNIAPILAAAGLSFLALRYVDDFLPLRGRHWLVVVQGCVVYLGIYLAGLGLLEWRHLRGDLARFFSSFSAEARQAEGSS